MVGSSNASSAADGVETANEGSESGTGHVNTSSSNVPANAKGAGDSHTRRQQQQKQQPQHEDDHSQQHMQQHLEGAAGARDGAARGAVSSDAAGSAVSSNDAHKENESGDDDDADDGDDGVAARSSNMLRCNACGHTWEESFDELAPTTIAPVFET